jgi:hypothetical protein
MRDGRTFTWTYGIFAAFTCASKEKRQRIMPFAQVIPVVDYSVKGLCVKPYLGHKLGCPNFHKRKDCPPFAPKITETLDIAKPVYAIWNAFDIGSHIAKMRAKHPRWSEHQLSCCLYWQPKARKALRSIIRAFLRDNPHLRAISTPEAQGVNLTATMASIGIILEWPPRNIAYQIVLAGTLPQK